MEKATLTQKSIENLANYSGEMLNLLEACSRIHLQVEKDENDVIGMVIDIYNTFEENPQLMNTVYDIFKNLYNRKYHPKG